MRKRLFFSTALTLSLASFSALAFHGSGGAGTSGDSSDSMSVPDSMFSKPGADTDGAGGSYGPGTVIARDEAPAAVGAPAKGPTLSSLDTNNDGLISRTEAESAPDVTSRFSDLDTNGDGYLSGTEYNPLGVSSLDTNADGYVSRGEADVDADISSRFAQLDKDNDGFLSASELDAGGVVAGVTAPTLDLDKNNDNYISRKEANADPDLKSRFTELDKDRDDYLSANEFAYGAPGGGGVMEEEVEPGPSMNLPPPSDAQGRGDAYSDVESTYRKFPDIKSIY